MDFDFWRKCERDGNNCWNWKGQVTNHGYGRYYTHELKLIVAHRYAVEQFQPIPKGMCIDHLCRNKTCVNPDHLEVVTTQENTRRHWALVTHCSRGHEFTPENTGHHNSRYRSYRTCLTCKRRRTNEERRSKRNERR